MSRLALVGLLLLVLLAALFASSVLRRTLMPPPPEPGPPYVRVEPPEVAAFYVPYAKFAAKVPPDLEQFLGALQERTRLERHAAAYPTDRGSLKTAADAFAEAARKVFGFALSLRDADDTQLDRFANAHLIDEGLRRFFRGPKPRPDLSAEEQEEYGRAVEALRVPDEPLLYYAMGAFWGEWLVDHRTCEWRLYPPLRPLQSFPDMLTAGNTVCLHPFSQVTKKLSDPEGDQLAFKAVVSSSMKRYFRPYLLTASLSDAEHAGEEGLPAGFREARGAEKMGQRDRAVALYVQALAGATPSARFYSFALPAAWEAQRWDLVEEWHLKALALEPGHPVLSHNLAALYSRKPDGLVRAIGLLETALREDPRYGRAHLTLASCLGELGKVAEAREHAKWVISNDPQLEAEARELLKSLK